MGQLDKLETQLRRSARDAVRLAWMEAPTGAELGRLDLLALAEYERKAGAVRVKLVDLGDLLGALVESAKEEDRDAAAGTYQREFLEAMQRTDGSS